jgi:hypothetical protein
MRRDSKSRQIRPQGVAAENGKPEMETRSRQRREYRHGGVLACTPRSSGEFILSLSKEEPWIWTFLSSL